MSGTIKFTTTAKVSIPQGLASVTTNPIILVSDGKLIGIPAGTELPVFNVDMRVTQEDTP